MNSFDFSKRPMLPMLAFVVGQSMNIDSPTLKTMVIVGGGFAGTTLARSLEGRVPAKRFIMATRPLRQPSRRTSMHHSTFRQIALAAAMAVTGLAHAGPCPADLTIGDIVNDKKPATMEKMM